MIIVKGIKRKLSYKMLDIDNLIREIRHRPSFYDDLPFEVSVKKNIRKVRKTLDHFVNLKYMGVIRDIITNVEDEYIIFKYYDIFPKILNVGEFIGIDDKEYRVSKVVFEENDIIYYTNEVVKLIDDKDEFEKVSEEMLKVCTKEWEEYKEECMRIEKQKQDDKKFKNKVLRFLHIK
ncbi:hypothetical protein EJM73_08780 [Clostridium botulinum]|uniref:hypothetical protein n=1 Tax=Clostridium botulinum TaxID=1491 RepID=UPI001375493C|nr:hypothetical protein [Clostridium botulinum]NCI19718.1 hypothetical protein [Clostridium botulinum]NCI35756.1 hypothetical protein [Clostridium botulinum]NCI71613.1 hypothetical protein [Clostridium botulinum]NDI38805.1 hypothetical protein [Clostridium botulinum]